MPIRSGANKIIFMETNFCSDLEAGANELLQSQHNELSKIIVAPVSSNQDAMEAPKPRKRPPLNDRYFAPARLVQI